MKRYTWRGLSASRCSPPERSRKICSCGSCAYALGADGLLYRCPEGEVARCILPEERLVDVCLSADERRLTCVSALGRVFELDPESGERSENFSFEGRNVRIRTAAAGGFGALFVDDAGRMWASGRMPQLDADAEENAPLRFARPVRFFEGRSVYRTVVGDGFAAAVVRKDFSDDEADSDDERRETPRPRERAPTSGSSEEAHALSRSLSSAEDTESIEPGSERRESVDAAEPHEFVGEIKLDREKSSTIFINTEAAKQFLTKQLSWVSAGEDYLVECTEKPTRIIKENVSNLTNLVVESVKTVGDKVATLSRHVSGGSESNENLEAEEDDAKTNSSRFLLSERSEELSASTSTVGDRDVAQNDLEEKAAAFAKTGRYLLNSEVWAWGDISYGQLGTGDTVRRSQPILISRLSNLGVHQICCGKTHCAALTLDGRVFLWGRNRWRQVLTGSDEDKTSPVRFMANGCTDRACDLACGDRHSVIFTLNGNLFFQGRHENGFTDDVINLNDSIEQNQFGDLHLDLKQNVSNKQTKKRKDSYLSLMEDLEFDRFVMCSESITSFCNFLRPIEENPLIQDFSIEQQFLEETISVHQTLVKPLLKKSNMLGADAKFYDNLCMCYANIMYFTAVNVLSFWKHVNYNTRVSEMAFVQNNEEHIFLYKKYLKCVCDILSVGGFHQISLHVDVSSILQNLFNDKLPSNTQKNSKKTSEALISYALMHPLTRLNTYKCMIQSIIRYNSINPVSESKMSLEHRLLDVLSKWDTFNDEYEKTRKEAERTKAFWDSYGRTVDSFRAPERRLVRESKQHTLSLLHSGRFSSHWFVLMNDVLLHLNGSTQTKHSLSVLWVEPITDSDAVQNAISLITPEESITVMAPTPQDKTEWLQALNSAVKSHLGKIQSAQPPMVRTSTHAFSTKSQFYKEAKYSGRWLNGKMHGVGKVEWPDGKSYHGQFYHNQLNGYGKMNMPGIGSFEGQWKDNLQNGFGVMKYLSGDVYEGYFKDGLAHGHGVRKQGDFTSSAANIYMGDWVQGVRQGYGVMDDIGKGEKYLGNWSDNKKHGCGLIVTLDGIYYEGVFANDTLTGHGVMIFEDGTHYEGEFRSAGVFSGRGTLTFSSGDKIEGVLSGAWTDGVKINNATLHMNVSNPALLPNCKPDSFGKLCVLPNVKWNGLFRQCIQQIGIPDSILTVAGTHIIDMHSPINNKKIWQNVAVSLSSASNDKSSKSLTKYKKVESEQLHVIPEFGQSSLSLASLNNIKSYLSKAVELPGHPLGRLVAGICAAFCTSYGGVRVHPLLLSHAVSELSCVSSRLYTIIQILFPSLPYLGEHITISKHEDSEEDEIISVSSIVQPLLLPRVHSALHILYALHHQHEDEAYWKRLLKWNRQTDVTLMAFLGIDQKFWIKQIEKKGTSTPVNEQMFTDAVDTLQQLKTTFSPMEKLLVIKSTFQQMTAVVQKQLGDDYLWTMDDLFPVFHFVVVRARILQLGSEIHFIEDFLEPCMQNGELGIMFTTLKACYYQILQEKVTMCD